MSCPFSKLPITLFDTSNSRCQLPLATCRTATHTYTYILTYIESLHTTVSTGGNIASTLLVAILFYFLFFLLTQLAVYAAGSSIATLLLLFCVYVLGCLMLTNNDMAICRFHRISHAPMHIHTNQIACGSRHFPPLFHCRRLTYVI